MTFQELCLSDPHRRSGAINKPWAVLVQTRLGKVWRFYRATNYAQAENKAFGSDDCMEALRIVPIYEEQYARGIANQRRLSSYNRRKARSSWAGN
jgi:hypothetical protein